MHQMTSTRRVFDEKKLTLKSVSDFLQHADFVGQIDDKNKALDLFHRNYAPFCVRISKRKSLIAISSVIQTKDGIQELDIAKLVRRLNDRSYFCNFSYNFSSKNGSALGAAASISIFNAILPEHLIHFLHGFGAEFLRLCIDKKNQKILYIKRNRLYLSK